jgi:hypothetical protein
MFTLLESVSAACEKHMKMSGVLGNQYENSAGINIFIHGYSQFAEPTWHSAKVSKPKDSGSHKDINSVEYAKAIHFLQPWTFKKKASLTYPSTESGLMKNFYLILKSNKDVNPPPSDYKLFKAPHDAAPRVRIFDPYNYDPSVFFSPILAGLVIETFEVAGFSIPQPNTNTTLDDENSLVLQSAVPLSHIKRSTTIDGTHHHYIIQPQPLDSTAQPVMVSLYNMIQDWLPFFNQDVGEDVPSNLYGFTRMEGSSFFTRAYSKFGYYVTNSENHDDAETTPNIEKGHVAAWSPYRYVSSALGRYKSPDDAPALDRFNASVYMLLNFRTVYGTNVTLADVKHFLESIPVN